MNFERLLAFTGLVFWCAHLSCALAYFCLGGPEVGGVIATLFGFLCLGGMYYVLIKFHIGGEFQLPRDYSRYVKDHRRYLEDGAAVVEDEDEDEDEAGALDGLGRYLLLAIVTPIGLMMLFVSLLFPLIGLLAIYWPWSFYLEKGAASSRFVQEGGFAAVTVGGSWVFAMLGFVFVSHAYENDYYRPRLEAYKKARKKARRKEAGKKAGKAGKEPQADDPPGSSEADKGTD